MGQFRNPRGGDDLKRVLEEGAQAATHDPDDAEIAADDAGATRLAEAVEAEEESQAHPS